MSNKLIRTVLVLSVLIFSKASFSEPKDIDITIESISSQGQWEIEGKEGSYRFVLYQYGFEHVVGELWVQWLQWETDKDGMYTHKVLVFEKPIVELNKLNYALEQPVCIKPWPCSEFKIEAFSTFEGTPNKKFIFKPLTVGSYSIEEVKL